MGLTQEAQGGGVQTITSSPQVVLGREQARHHLLPCLGGFGHAVSPNDNPSMVMDVGIPNLILHAILNDGMMIKAPCQQIKRLKLKWPKRQNITTQPKRGLLMRGIEPKWGTCNGSRRQSNWLFNPKHASHCGCAHWTTRGNTQSEETNDSQGGETTHIRCEGCLCPFYGHSRCIGTENNHEATKHHCSLQQRDDG